MDLGDGVIVEDFSVVHELNVAMTWLAYPGRHEWDHLAEEVDFATAGGTRR